MNCAIDCTCKGHFSSCFANSSRMLRELREFNDPWRGGTARDRDFLQLSRNLLGLQSTLMQILNPQQPQKIIIIEENGKMKVFLHAEMSRGNICINLGSLFEWFRVPQICANHMPLAKTNIPTASNQFVADFSVSLSKHICKHLKSIPQGSGRSHIHSFFIFAWDFIFISIRRCCLKRKFSMCVSFPSQQQQRRQVYLPSTSLLFWRELNSLRNDWEIA